MTIMPRPCHSSHNGRGLCGGKYQLPTDFPNTSGGAQEAMEEAPIDAFVARLNLRPYPSSPVHLPGRKW
jgi:hypothetical protein